MDMSNESIGIEQIPTDLLDALKAWHRARFCANQDPAVLAHTDEDLRDACRSHFEH